MSERYGLSPSGGVSGFNPLGRHGVRLTQTDRVRGDGVMSTKTLVKLADYPLPNYVKAGTVTHKAHTIASQATSGDAYALRTLADAIERQAALCGPGGHADWSRSAKVAYLLDTFVDLLNYDRGGFDGGTCSSWAFSVAEYIGRPLT